MSPYTSPSGNRQVCPLTHLLCLPPSNFQHPFIFPPRMSPLSLRQTYMPSLLQRLSRTTPVMNPISSRHRRPHKLTLLRRIPPLFPHLPFRMRSKDAIVKITSTPPSRHNSHHGPTLLFFHRTQTCSLCSLSNADSCIVITFPHISCCRDVLVSFFPFSFSFFFPVILPWSFLELPIPAYIVALLCWFVRPIFALFAPPPTMTITLSSFPSCSASTFFPPPTPSHAVFPFLPPFFIRFPTPSGFFLSLPTLSDTMPFAFLFAELYETLQGFPFPLSSLSVSFQVRPLLFLSLPLTPFASRVPHPCCSPPALSYGA